MNRHITASVVSNYLVFSVCYSCLFCFMGLQALFKRQVDVFERWRQVVIVFVGFNAFAVTGALAIPYTVQQIPLPSGSVITGFNDFGEISFYLYDGVIGNNAVYTTYIYSLITNKTKKLPTIGSIIDNYVDVAINDQNNILNTPLAVYSYDEFSLYSITNGTLKTFDVYPACGTFNSTMNNNGLIGGLIFAFTACGPVPYIYNTATSTPTYLGNGDTPSGETHSINDAGMALFTGGFCSAVACLYDYNKKKYYNLSNNYQYLSINNNNDIFCTHGGAPCIYDITSQVYYNIEFSQEIGIYSRAFFNNNGIIVGSTRTSTDGPITYFFAFPSVSKPEIIFNGKDITDTSPATFAPPRVAVGQPVILTAELPSSLGAVASQQWSIDGKQPIGGFSATPASFQTGDVLPWVSNQQATQFYWVAATDTGAYYTVTYSYKLKSGQSGTVETKFSVAPAPQPSVQAQYGTVGADWIYKDPEQNNELYMGFGNPVDGNLGITFTVLTPPGKGAFEWVQLIDKDVIIYTGGQYKQCTSSGGLDSEFPYRFDLGSKVQTSDSPAVNLTPITGAIRMFRAKMYLMWKSVADMSIPVPLGFTPWGFSESSHLTKDGWLTPLVTFVPLPVGNGFTVDTKDYPLWNNLSEFACK